MVKSKKIHNYINYEDLKEKLGYRTYKPRLGVLGKALLEASKKQKANNFLKRYWDSYFKKLRQKRKGQTNKK